MEKKWDANPQKKLMTNHILEEPGRVRHESHDPKPLDVARNFWGPGLGEIIQNNP